MLRFLSAVGVSIAAVGMACAQHARPNDGLKPTSPTPQNPTQQQPDESNRAADLNRAQQEGPGAEHRQLENLVGSWQFTGQCFEKCGDKDSNTTRAGELPKDAANKATPATPAKPESEAVTGTNHSEWVLGGRFVRCEVKGTHGNKSMNGIAMTGYDTEKRRFVSTWMDDQCNSIKTDEGTYDPSTRTFTFIGESTGPDGQTVRCRRVVKITSRDEHTMTTYLTTGGQAEKQVAELTFRRTNQAARGNTPASP